MKKKQHASNMNAPMVGSRVNPQGILMSLPRIIDEALQESDHFRHVFTWYNDI